MSAIAAEDDSGEDLIRVGIPKSRKVGCERRSLLGTVCAGWLLGCQAQAALRRAGEAGDASGFLADKVRTARFYAEHFLGLAPGYLPAVRGGATVLGFAPERL